MPQHSLFSMHAYRKGTNVPIAKDMHALSSIPTFCASRALMEGYKASAIPPQNMIRNKK